MNYMTDAGAEGLLEAMDLYGDDWNKISAALGQPIDVLMSQFMSLPLKDLVKVQAPKNRASEVLGEQDLEYIKQENVSMPRAVQRA